MLFTVTHGQPYGFPLPPGLLQSATEIGLVSSGRGKRVGLLISGQDQLVVVPGFYSSTEPERGQKGEPGHVTLMRAVLRRYETFRRSADEDLSGSRVVESSGDALEESEILAFLLKDFLANRKLRRHIIHSSRLAAGSIDWPRTLSRSEWIDSDEGNYLPQDLWTRSRRQIVDDPIDRAHEYAVRRANCLFGGGLGGAFGAPPDDGDSPSHAIESLITKELNRTFRSRERRVLVALKRYYELQRLSSNRAMSRSNNYYVVLNFEYVWEDVLREAFDIVRLDVVLARGRQFVPGEKMSYGIGPVPDLVVRIPDADGSSVGIVDGKYYLQNAESALGSAGDHYKQIIYAQLLTTLGFSPEINVLAFPELTQFDAPYARLIRSHYWKGLSGSRVCEVAIDFDRSARAYTGLSKRVNPKFIIDEITHSATSRLPKISDGMDSN